MSAIDKEIRCDQDRWHPKVLPMRPPPELRPSRFSTTAFGLLAFLVIGITGVISGTIYEDIFQWSYADPDRSTPEEVAFWWGLIAGCMGAALAVWGWRAPRERRFHIAFLSGLALLITAYLYVLQFRILYERAETFAASWLVMERLLQGPVFAWFVGILGLVLILAALIQDRR